MGVLCVIGRVVAEGGGGVTWALSGARTASETCPDRVRLCVAGAVGECAAMTDTFDTTEKKSERLEVRLGYREKGAFVEACEMQGDTPSGAVRRFISGYVRRADGDILASA